MSTERLIEYGAAYEAGTGVRLLLSLWRFRKGMRAQMISVFGSRTERPRLQGVVKDKQGEKILKILIRVGEE